MPTEHTDTAEGRTLTYVSYWNRTMMAITTCRQTFTIDAKGKITAHEASGCSR